eukprot:3446513-Rhodomonas_salina.1
MLARGRGRDGVHLRPCFGFLKLHHPRCAVAREPLRGQQHLLDARLCGALQRREEHGVFEVDERLDRSRDLR